MAQENGREAGKDSILAALRQIEDPDLHRDIVTLGFVKDDDINVCGGNVSVRIVLTTPACPVREKMQRQAEELLLALPEVDHAEVTMDATVRSTGVRQLMHDIPWGEDGELDYLIVDLPPGTSDASMSAAQEAPIAGAVIVTTPNAVSLEDAMKAVSMFEKLGVPVFGMVENMSYF